VSEGKHDGRSDHRSCQGATPHLIDAEQEEAGGPGRVFVGEHDAGR
jgi:hypothetical protein